MKKLLSLILILVVVFSVIYFLKNISVDSTNTTTSRVSKPDPSNATFIFDEGPISLKNGSNLTPVVEGGATMIETTLTNMIEYGDINKDNKDDAVVVIVQDGGGSGVFTYIAGFVSNPADYKGSNAIFIGDRIEPKSVSISNGIITLKYLDRKPGESFAIAPSVSVSKQFVYSNGNLVER
jgi:hypothetical protein